MENDAAKPPVVFAHSSNRGVINSKSLFAQNLLLEAMAGGELDPKKLQQIAGLKKVSDVYLALDKLALRKEYHAALERSGMDLDYILKKLKKVIDQSAANQAKEVSPLQINVALGPIIKLGSKLKPDPTAKAIVELLEKSAGKDHISVILKPIKNGEHGFRGGDPKEIEDAYNTMREFIVKHLESQ